MSFIFASSSSKCLIPIQENEQPTAQSFTTAQKVTFFVENFILPIVMVAGLLALLAYFNVPMGPLNHISKLGVFGAVGSSFLIGISLAVFTANMVLFFRNTNRVIKQNSSLLEEKPQKERLILTLQGQLKFLRRELKETKNNAPSQPNKSENNENEEELTQLREQLTAATASLAAKEKVLTSSKERVERLEGNIAEERAKASGCAAETKRASEIAEKKSADLERLKKELENVRQQLRKAQASVGEPNKELRAEPKKASEKGKEKKSAPPCSPHSATAPRQASAHDRELSLAIEAVNSSFEHPEQLPTEEQLQIYKRYLIGMANADKIPLPNILHRAVTEPKDDERRIRKNSLSELSQLLNYLKSREAGSRAIYEHFQSLFDVAQLPPQDSNFIQPEVLIRFIETQLIPFLECCQRVCEANSTRKTLTPQEALRKAKNYLQSHVDCYFHSELYATLGVSLLTLNIDKLMNQNSNKARGCITEIEMMLHGLYQAGYCTDEPQAIIKFYPEQIEEQIENGKRLIIEDFKCLQKVQIALDNFVLNDSDNPQEQLKKIEEQKAEIQQAIRNVRLNANRLQKFFAGICNTPGIVRENARAFHDTFFNTN